MDPGGQMDMIKYIDYLNLIPQNIKTKIFNEKVLIIHLMAIQNGCICIQG